VNNPVPVVPIKNTVEIFVCANTNKQQKQFPDLT
jgi:hypothetical protein